MSQHILITGISTGIGYHTTKKFLSNNDIIVIGTVRNEKDKIRLEKEFGENLVCIIMDVRDMESVQMAKTTINKNGISHLNLLINNAGIAIPGPLKDLPIEDFEHQMDVNVNGIIRVTNTFLPMLGASLNAKYTAGRIINISSVSGLFNTPMLGAYCISKHALESISDIYRRELSIYGIDVICVEPDPIKSEIWEKAISIISKFQFSDYAPILKDAEAKANKSMSNAMDAEILAQKLLGIYKSRKVKARYIVSKKKLANYIFHYLVPTQLKDFFIKKMLHKRLLKENEV